MSKNLRNYTAITYVWATASIVGVPLLLAVVYDRLGPGLLAGLAGSPPTGLSVIDGSFLILVASPLLALIVFGVFIYHAIRLWRSHPKYLQKIILILVFILATVTTIIVCFWRALTT